MELRTAIETLSVALSHDEGSIHEDAMRKLRDRMFVVEDRARGLLAGFEVTAFVEKSVNEYAAIVRSGEYVRDD